MFSYDLPPGPRWRQYELKAQGLRDFARIRSDARLDPFALASFANLLVVDFNQIQALSKEARDHLLGPATEEWSGGACSLPLPDGRRIVILNPNHSRARTHATLMEEISHVFLGHQPSRLTVAYEDARGRTVYRDYCKTDEEAAYATGAAALVPFAALRSFVLRGKTIAAIAGYFRVSRSLVAYRLKVTRLWNTYRGFHAGEE